MTLNIGRELAALRHMGVAELREKYLEAFGEPTRAGNRDFLFKRIAWRIQALAEGDLSERARRRAELLARDADLRTTAPKMALDAPDPKPPTAARDRRVPPPGTVLTRVYRGHAYHVVVRDDGFEHDGQVFRSLSAIAKLITGSHWNGLLFFKITKPKAGRAAETANPTPARATRRRKPQRREATHA